MNDSNDKKYVSIAGRYAIAAGFLAVLTFLYFPSQGYGDVWKYTDADGRAWYVNNPDFIPEQFRTKAQKVVESSSTEGRPRVKKATGNKTPSKKSSAKRPKVKKAKKAKRPKGSPKSKSKYKWKGS